MEKYPGIIRNITIRGDAEVKIDFHDIHTLEIDEGEVTFYLKTHCKHLFLRLQCKH